MKNPFAHRHEFQWLPLINWAVIFIAIILFTLATLPNVLQASAYFDEGYSAYLAKQDLWSMAIYTALDVHPPLYYAVLHFWGQIFGSGVAELRLLSVVFGWIAIIFGFLIVRRSFGYRAAWLATFLMALSPLFIRYGASMRMYTMALAIGLAATYVLMIAKTSKKRWPWVIYALLVALGMWTNYFTALIWIAHFIWIAYEDRKKRRALKAWLISIATAVVLYLPWLPALLYRAGEIQVSGFWIKPLSIDTLVSTITTSLVFRSSSNTTSWLAVGVIALIGTLLFVGWRTYHQLDKDKKPSFRLIATLTALPVLLLAVASLPPLRPAYVYRYILFASVMSSLLIAVIVTYARFRRHDMVKKFLLYALAIIIFASGAYRATVIGNRNLDTDSQNKLAQVIYRIDKAEGTSHLVLRSPYSYYAASLYASDKLDIKYLYNDSIAKIGSTRPLFDHPRDGVKTISYNKFWFVGEDRNSVAPPREGNWKVIQTFVEYDDINKKPAAYARQFERVQ